MIKDTQKNLEQFWNEAFKEEAPQKVEENDLAINGTLGDELIFLGNSCHRILDVGCGDGLLTMKCAFNQPEGSILGLDQSKNGIQFAKETAIQSQLTNLSFKVGGLEELRQLDEESYDGIICSNLLDVIPSSLSKEFIKEIKRLLKPQGYLLLKVNFYLDEESKKRYPFANDTDVYLDGVLRLVNEPTSFWIKSFKELTLLKQEGFARLEKGPLDRLFLFQK